MPLKFKDGFKGIKSSKPPAYEVGNKNNKKDVVHGGPSYANRLKQWEKSTFSLPVAPVLYLRQKDHRLCASWLFPQRGWRNHRKSFLPRKACFLHSSTGLDWRRDRSEPAPRQDSLKYNNLVSVEFPTFIKQKVQTPNRFPFAKTLYRIHIQ